LPNGTIANAKVTRHDPIAWDYIEIGFSYDDPPHRIIPALEKVVREMEAIEDPYVGITSYDDSCITYQVWFMGAIGFKIWLGKMELLKRIYYLAQREGFTIPYPINFNYKIDIPDGLPAKIPQRPEEYNPEIAEGLVQLFVLDGQARTQEVDQILGGSFFGEMALLLGEISPISAIAMNEVQVLIIDHSSAQNLIDLSPKFAREMNHLIEERKRSLLLAQGIDNLSAQKTIDNGDLKLPSLLGKVIKHDI